MVKVDDDEDDKAAGTIAEAEVANPLSDKAEAPVGCDVVSGAWLMAIGTMYPAAAKEAS